MNVQMEKTRLLAILKDNKKEHVELYNEAHAGFLKEADKVLKDITKNLKKNNELDWSALSALTRPVSYEESYEEIIEMLEHTNETTIFLTQQEFKNYVLDKWNWGSQFSLSNSAYLSVESTTKLARKLR